MLQDHFLPDARYPWAVKAINLAYRERVIWSYPDHEPSGKRRPPSRYEYAVAFIGSVASQIEQAERFVKGEGSDVDRAALLRSAPVLMPFYRRAETEFQKEYAFLGVGKGPDLARLSDLVRQVRTMSPLRQRLFSDVPPDHWAAKAVGDLRALGLLDGYPDGTFRG